MHMLDTDTASYVIKGRSENLNDRLLMSPPGALCISAITRAELIYGLKRLAPEHRLHNLVRQFLNLLPTLAWGSDAAEHYADIRLQLISDGKPIGEMDMMIAAHALAADAILVTNNTRHFKRIAAPLRMANWLEPDQAPP